MSIVNLTKENIDQIIMDNELVFVDFWAEWCGPCKSFASIYEETATKHPDVVFAKIDIEHEKELAEDFNVRSIPLLMVFKQGVAVFSEAGVVPTSMLHDLIGQAQKLDMTEVHKETQRQEQNNQ